MRFFKKRQIQTTILCVLAIIYSSKAHSETKSEAKDPDTSMPCYLEKGYQLPEGVEFADECYFTDMKEDNIIWLVTKKQDMLTSTYGFVNNQGKIVIPIQYSRANAFMEGVANVKINDKWGFINSQGDLVIPHQYKHASRFRSGLAKVVKNRKYGYINHDNKIVIPFEFDDARDFFEGSASAKMPSKDKYKNWGVIDSTGKVLIPFEYDLGINQIIKNDVAWHFRASKDGKDYIFDKHGNLAFPVYKKIGIFAEGLANVKKDDKWGFVDKDNHTKIDFIYDNAVGFFNGLALVKKDEKYGFINPRGEAVIPIEYDTIKSPFFKNKYVDRDTISAYKDGKYYFLYKDGTAKQLKYDYVYEYFSGIKDDLIVVGIKSDKAKNSGKMLYGVINKHGEVVLPIQYLSVDFPVTGIYRNMPTVFTQDKKVYVLNEQGKIIADKTEEYKMMLNY